MHAGRTFLEDLALALCVAAVTSVLFQRLRLPAVLGYLLAGVIVGPHLRIVPLFASRERIEELSQLGVTLVMFSVGLEFTVGRLVKTLPTAGLTRCYRASDSSGSVALQAGDVLALSGTQDAVEAARAHLHHGAPTLSTVATEG